MRSKEVLELIRAGYTKDEINELFADDSGEQTQASEQETQASEQETQAAEQETQGEDRIAELENSIMELKTIIQKSNINNRGVETVPELSAEQALGSLITKKGK